jgi:hypothetical protein
MQSERARGDTNDVVDSRWHARDESDGSRQQSVCRGGGGTYMKRHGITTRW